MITKATIPARRPLPAYVVDVENTLHELAGDIERLWAGDGIDGRRVAALLKDALSGWELERAGSLQSLSWDGASIRPFLVDGQRGQGRAIIEIEGGGALQNNRLHRDLLNVMLLDDVEHLVLVVPNWVHGRSPFDYAVQFASRLRDKRLLPSPLTITAFGYGSPPSRR